MMGQRRLNPYFPCGIPIFPSYLKGALISIIFLFSLVDSIPQYSAERSVSNYGSSTNNAHRHHHSTGRHYSGSSDFNQLPSSRSSSKELHRNSENHHVISPSKCEQVFHHFVRKGFKVSHQSSGAHHPRSKQPHLPTENSSLVIAPTNQMFCPNQGIGCCSGDWTQLLDHTWSLWVGNSFHKRFRDMQISLKKGIDSFEEYKRDKTHLKCRLDVVPNQVEDLLPLEEETLNSLQSLFRVDWAKLVYEETSQECRLKLVQSYHCSACGGHLMVQPCHGLCHNLLHGCLHPLRTHIRAPWKHSVNAVNTAIRLLSTKQKPECADHRKGLKEFLTELSEWREPWDWFSETCEGLDNHRCYNGNEIGVYKKSKSNWKSNDNPEFPYPTVATATPSPLAESITEILLNITKRLEKYWPRISTDSGGDLYSSSQESVVSNSQESNTSDRLDSYSYEDFDGSGSGDYYYNYDYSHRFLPDDEDYPPYPYGSHFPYSGDGSGDGTGSFYGQDNDHEQIFTASRPTGEGSTGGDPSISSGNNPSSSTNDFTTEEPERKDQSAAAGRIHGGLLWRSLLLVLVSSSWLVLGRLNL